MSTTKKVKRAESPGLCSGCGHHLSRSYARVILSRTAKVDYRQCCRCGLRWKEKRTRVV